MIIMRSWLKFFGIAALLAAIGLSMSGCPTDTPDPTVTGVTLSPASANVARGGNQDFTATVSGTNNPPTTVTWAVEGGVPGTSISTAGRLSVAANETATTLTVRATSTFDTGRSGTASVTVPAPGAEATVTSVTLSPASANVARGGNRDFSATVSGTNNPPQTVSWAVEGGVSGTSISSTGRLSVAANETALSLTVRATSTLNTAVSGTASVTVTAPGEDNGTPGQAGDVRNINLGGAHALMVAPRGFETRARTGVQAFSNADLVLYMQDEAGNWSEVRMNDAAGNQLEVEAPRYIMELTEGWVVMEWADGTAHLVSTSAATGNNVFEVSGLGLMSRRDFPYGLDYDSRQGQWDVWHLFYDQSLVHAVNANRIFVLVRESAAANWRIAELSISGGQATRSLITPPAFNVRQFAVDSSGNILIDVGTHFMIRPAGATGAVAQTITVPPGAGNLNDNRRHTRPLAKSSSHLVIADSRNEVEAQAEASPTVPVPLRKNAKAFDKPYHVLVANPRTGKLAVLTLVLFA